MSVLPCEYFIFGSIFTCSTPDMEVSQYQELTCQKLCLEKYPTMKISYRLILSHFIWYYNCVGERGGYRFCRKYKIYFSWKRIGIKTWLLVSEEHRQKFALCRVYLSGTGILENETDVKQREFSMLVFYKPERSEVCKIYSPGIYLAPNLLALVLIMLPECGLLFGGD